MGVQLARHRMNFGFRRLTAVTAVVSVVSLAACQTLEDEKFGLGVIGSAITATATGACVAIAGKTDAATVGGCAILGVLAGELSKVIGSEIMKHLKEKDQEKVVLATSDSLRTGVPVTLELPDSDAIVEITPEPSNGEFIDRELAVNVETAAVVSIPGRMQSIGETRTVLKNSNLRSGPGTDFGKIDLLEAGQNVHVYGELEDKEWLMVGRRFVDDFEGEIPLAVGYVHSSLISNEAAVKLVDGQPVADDFIWQEPRERTATVEEKKVVWRASCTPTTITLQKMSDKADVTKSEALLCKGPVGTLPIHKDAVS